MSKIAFMCVFLFAFQAKADDLAIPDFDVNDRCAHLSAQVPREAIRNCIQSEQTFYDDLKTMWGDLPVSDRTRCTAQSRAVRNYNYTFLRNCLGTAIWRLRNAAPITPFQR